MILVLAAPTQCISVYAKWIAFEFNFLIFKPELWLQPSLWTEFDFHGQSQIIFEWSPTLLCIQIAYASSFCDNINYIIVLYCKTDQFLYQQHCNIVQKTASFCNRFWPIFVSVNGQQTKHELKNNIENNELVSALIILRARLQTTLVTKAFEKCSLISDRSWVLDNELLSITKLLGNAPLSI